MLYRFLGCTQEKQTTFAAKNVPWISQLSSQAMKGFLLRLNAWMHAIHSGFLRQISPNIWAGVSNQPGDLKY